MLAYTILYYHTYIYFYNYFQKYSDTNIILISMFSLSRIDVKH